MSPGSSRFARLKETFYRSLTLSRLEWVGILAPIGFLLLYHYVILGPGNRLLHSATGVLLLIVFISLVVTVFSRLMFRAIARLQRQVAELSRVAASRNVQLRALNEANLALSEERLTSSVLQRVVDLSRELVQARYAALCVADESGRIKTFLTSGIGQKTRQAIGRLPSGKGLLGLILEGGQPLRLENIKDHPASTGFPPGHPAMNTFLGVPIRYKQHVVGSLYLTEKESGAPFTETDEEVVQLFANQAAVAIQNARLNEQIQALAVEAERIRLSREMHDGLAQVLGYVSTKAQAVEAFMAKGDVDVAQEQVRELSQAARKVYQDIREGILALRSQIGPDQELKGVLEEYVNEYQLQLHKPVEVQWNLHPEDIDLTPLQEVQILRIVQEALTNVRKHAEAGHVSVRFTARDADLEIEVADDGIGFNPMAVRRGEWPHLGLQTMQERAEAIGGNFEVDSTIGRGTVVRVRVPGAVQPRVGRDTR